MDLHSLLPALEQHSLDESRHLPSLTPNPNPNPDPKLRPVSSTAFKREARKMRKERKRQEKLAEKLESLLAFETPTRPPDSASGLFTVEWPCSEISSDPNPEPTGWPAPDPNRKPEPEPAPIAPPEPQQNVLKQCQDFFSANDDDDDEEEEEDVGESGNFEFFVGLFENDEELRGFYEKSWEKGDFCCLVCGAIGEKMGKRYGSCVGLVQHANTVLKTKRRGAHRDFGRAVCRVLEWDIDKLPGVFYGQSPFRDGYLLQVYVALNLLNQLIPPVAHDEQDIQLVLGKEKIIIDEPKLSFQFAVDILPALIQENIQKQVGIIEEAGPHKGAGDPIGPDKGELMDYIEADPSTD